MTTIFNRAARASLASYRRAAALARLRAAFSMDTGEFPGVEIFASQAWAYRLHVMEVTQNLSALQAHRSTDLK